MGVYPVRDTQKRRSEQNPMERTKRRRHPCRNLSANPFADQGRLLPPPGPPASLSPFRCCYDPEKSENPGLDSAAVMGVPFVSPLFPCFPFVFSHFRRRLPSRIARDSAENRRQES